ncbi:MAG: chromate efflux transporter [Acidobacteria bacterium]|nr:chromate efflux transporter [Acidobacteriota bacterium]
MSAMGRTFFEILGTFLSLGCRSFGGPVAHLGYFRNEFVARRKWLSENAFADIVALCQFLPGPASSQVGFCIGIRRGGTAGGFAAWLGFTAPSAAIMIAFAYGVTFYGDILSGNLLRGFKILALAVVAQAVVGMARTLCPDRTRIILALAAAGFVLVFPASWTQVAVILLGAIAGWILFHGEKAAAGKKQIRTKGSGARGGVFLAGFFALLLVLPSLSGVSENRTLHVVDSFYRVGSLVFGGGHVVLPLVQAEVVPRGWITENAFIAGYGAAQAVPGPLFTFSAYLGAAMDSAPKGWQGGLIALGSIFLPALLLVLGVYPIWESLRGKTSVQSALKGANAVVVGILLAALYHPVWTQAVDGVWDFLIAAAAFCLLQFAKAPVVLVLLGCAAVSLLR